MKEDVIYEEIHNIDGLFKLCYTIENSEDEKIYVNFKTTDTSLYSKIALEKIYIFYLKEVAM